jgi:hypothetical protein
MVRPKPEASQLSERTHCDGALFSLQAKPNRHYQWLPNAPVSIVCNRHHYIQSMLHPVETSLKLSHNLRRQSSPKKSPVFLTSINYSTMQWTMFCNMIKLTVVLTLPESASVALFCSCASLHKMADKGRLSVEQRIKTALFFIETRSVVVT